MEEAEDLTKSLVILLEPVNDAYHPETAACWRVLTSQEKLQVQATCHCAPAYFCEFDI